MNPIRHFEGLTTRFPWAIWPIRAGAVALAAAVYLACWRWAALLSPSIYLFGLAAALAGALAVGPATAGVIAALALAGGLVTGRSNGLAPPLIFSAAAVQIVWVAVWFRGFRRRSALTLSELANQEAVNRSIIETGPDAMLMIDSQGVVSSFSPSAEQLFGWKAGEVIGNNVSMLMPQPYHGEHDGYIRRYIATGERQIIGKSREVTGLRKNGTHFPMVLHVGEVKIGEQRQFTGFVHDLTALRDAHDRTQDLRVQLAHVWSMNSLGEMAAVLAHELNQPLSAIANYIRGARTIVARLELADDDLLEAVDKAGDQAIRAGEIIRRMRSLVARKDMNHQSESVAAMISEIEFMVALVARDGEVTVRYRLAEGPDEVQADRVQIQQVVSNLVRNAVEAMQGMARSNKRYDKPTLEIISEASEDGWVVRIEDSGPGIRAEMIDKIFEPLASNKAHGMGLGLSISRAIIENHGGQLWVDKSRLGGAAFCFMLPIAGQDASPGGESRSGLSDFRGGRRRRSA